MRKTPNNQYIITFYGTRGAYMVTKTNIITTTHRVSVHFHFFKNLVIFLMRTQNTNNNINKVIKSIYCELWMVLCFQCFYVFGRCSAVPAVSVWLCASASYFFLCLHSKFKKKIKWICCCILSLISGDQTKHWASVALFTQRKTNNKAQLDRRPQS